MPVIKVDFSDADVEFSPVEPGEYRAQIVSVEQREARETGKPYLNVGFQLLDNGRRVWRNYSLQPQALWALKQLLVAAGVDPEQLSGETELDTDELVGAEVTVTIGHREWEGTVRAEVRSVR